MVHDPPLNPESVESWLAHHPGWSRNGGILSKEYRFQRFRDAVVFVNRVATVADQEDRYPAIELQRERVRVRLGEPGAPTVTPGDLDLAEKIDFATPRR